MPFLPVENTEVMKGEGIVASVGGHRVAVGNAALMERERVTLDEKMKSDIDRFEKKETLLC